MAPSPQAEVNLRTYQIEVAGLQLFGYHGYYEIEAKQGQLFLLDLWLDVESVDTHSDQLQSYVDYGKMVQEMVRVFNANRYRTIESLAEAILEVFIGTEGLKKARLRIRKPEPPIPHRLDHVAVVFERAY